MALPQILVMRFEGCGLQKRGQTPVAEFLSFEW